VEGAIDCIYYPNSISLMGKTITRDTELYNKLKEKANAHIIICLDGDTTMGEVKRIYRTLDRGRLHNKIKYIRLGEGLNGRYVRYIDPVIENEEIPINLDFVEVDNLAVSDGKNPQYVMFNGVKYTYEGYKDFGEVYESEGRMGIIKAMRTAKQFEEIELLV
jgi:hypothetical protein